MSRFNRAHALLLAALGAAAPLAAAANGARQPEPAPAPSAAPEAPGGGVHSEAVRLPMTFEKNAGQTDASVRYLARGRGYSLYLTEREAVLTLRNAAQRDPARGAVVRMSLAGASEHSQLSGVGEQEGRVSYMRGNDPAAWKTGVPTYGKVRYAGVYPGVDLLYYGSQHQLEYDFVLQPRADPGRIRLQFAGAERAAISPQGDLVLSVPGGELRHHRPVCYQVLSGRRVAVDGRYVLLPEGCGSMEVWKSGSGSNSHTPTLPHSHTSTRVGFQLAAYDHSKPLVIDPVLLYGTYLGGSGGEVATAVAVDSKGNMYLTGETDSPNFPTAGSIQLPQGAQDVFVTKIKKNGHALAYSTYLGGSGNDVGSP